MNKEEPHYDAKAITVALLEGFVESLLGKRFVDALGEGFHAKEQDKEDLKKIESAFHKAQNRFLGTYEDESIANQLNKILVTPSEARAKIRDAAVSFIKTPSDTELSFLLKAELQIEHQELADEQADAAVNRFLGILLEELASIDTHRKLREKIVALSILRQTELLQHLTQSARFVTHQIPQADSVSLRDYADLLREEHAVLTFPGIPGISNVQPSIDDIYVFQYLIQDSKLPYDQAISREDGRLLIEDAAGTGKSTLFRKMVIDQVEHFIQHGLSTPIPLVFIAKTMRFQEQGSLENYVLKQLVDRYHLSPTSIQTISSAIEANNTFLIVDGLDEMTASQRMEFVRAFNSSKFMKNRVLITTRALGNTGLTTLKKTSLGRFDLSDAFSLVKHWQSYLVKAEKINDQSARNLDLLKKHITDVFERDSVSADILKIPLYLTYITFAFVSPPPRFKQNIGQLLQDRFTLFEQIFEHLIPYWQEQKGNILPSRTLLMEGLGFSAIHLFEQPFDTEMRTVDSFGRWFAAIHPQTDYESIEASLRFWVNTGTLKIGSDSSLDFWHREFQEYCAARFLCRHSEVYRDLKTSIRSDPGWRGVRTMLSALEGKGQCK